MEPRVSFSAGALGNRPGKPRLSAPPSAPGGVVDTTFGDNLQAACVAIDSLKALVQRLGDIHASELVGGRLDLKKELPKTPLTSPRVCEPRDISLGNTPPKTQTFEVAQPHPDRIDVIDDYEDPEETSNASDRDDREARISRVDVRDESARVEIRDCWSPDDLKTPESLVSVQKKLRQTRQNFKKKTGALAGFHGFKKSSFALGEVRLAMMHPQSRPRLCWTCLSLVFVAWDMLTIPLQTLQPPDQMSPWSLDLIICLFWTHDILMSFRTGVFRKGFLIMEPTIVAKEYLLSWLLPDLVVVSVEWISLFASAATRGFALARGVRLTRLIRLLRIAKVYAFMGAIEHRFSFVAGTLQLFLYNVRLVIVLCVLIHILACSWYGLGELDTRNGWTTVENVGHEEVAYRYFLSMRWTLAQINGRTDLERRTTIEYAFTCFVIVSAFLLISLFISGITNTMMQIGTANAELKRSKEVLRKFVDHKGVSAELAMEVKVCHAQRSRNKADDLKIQDVLKELPKPMMFEVLQQVRAPRLKVHALFSKFSSAYPMPFRHLCAEAVQSVLALPDEVIFEPGEACSRMLIVDSGVMVYYPLEKQQPSPTGLIRVSSHSKIDAEEKDIHADGGEFVGKGRWVTESALWAFWETRGRLKSTSMSNMLAMEASDVARVLDLYKDARALVSFYAVLYVEAIHDGRAFHDVVDTHVISDVTQKVMSESATVLLARMMQISRSPSYRLMTRNSK